MGRHREKPLGHWYLWDKPDSPYWWVYRYDKDNPQKRIYKRTKKRKAEYTKKQMNRIINTVQGIVSIDKAGDYSIDRMEQYIIRKLRLEELSEKTIEVYQNAFNHLRSVYSGHTSILNLTRDAIDDIKEHFIAQDLDPNVCLKTLRAAFQRLYDDELIDRNPFLRFKPMRRKKKSKLHLTLSELRDFLDFVKKNADEDTWRLLKIYAGTGRRRNEILYLKHQHVDVERGIYRPIDIKSRDKHRLTRSIPEDVLDDFRYFIEKYPTVKYPFKICHEATITHRAIELFRKAGYPTLNLHSLRHSYLTILEEIGYTDREIQLIIGHSNQVVTRGYLHKQIENSPSIGIS